MQEQKCCVTFVVHAIIVFTLTYIGKLFVIVIVWHQSCWQLTLVVVNVIVWFVCACT